MKANPKSALPLFCKLAFALCTLFAISFWFSQGVSLNVDTDINDLSPNTVVDSDQKLAIESLREHLQASIVWVLRGDEDEVLEDAAASLKKQLAQIQGLQVDLDQLLQTQYLELIKQHRFHLLAEKQSQSLSSQPKPALVEQFKAELFRSGEKNYLIPFEQDPLALLGDFVIEQAQTSGLLSVDAQSEQETFYRFLRAQVDGNVMELSLQQSLLPQIEQVTDSIQETYAVNVLQSGVIFFAAEAAGGIKADIIRVVATSTLGILLLVFLVFRAVGPILLAVCSIIVGALFAVAIVYSLWGSIHILTIVFGGSLIGIAVDYSLHYLYHQQHSVSVLSAKNQSASRSVLYRAMMLSLVTSLLGYSALGFSSLDVLRKVAVFSCAGLLMSWLFIIACGHWVSYRSVIRESQLISKLADGLVQCLSARFFSLPWLALFVLLVAVLLVSNQKIRFNDDPSQFFYISQEMLEQERELADIYNSFEPGRFFLVQSNDLDSLYEKLDKLTQQAQQKFSLKLHSIADWLPSPSMQKENYGLQAKLYAKEGVIDNLMAEINVPQAAYARSQEEYQQAKGQSLSALSLVKALQASPPLIFKRDSVYTSVVLVFKGGDFQRLRELSDPESGVHYINSLEDAKNNIAEQRLSASGLMLLAYGLVALMLLMSFKRLGSLAFILIPFFSSIVTLVSLSLLGEAITVFHIMALFLVLGLGMDYIIFAREMSKESTITRQAILLSAMTTLLSFGLLAFSSMPVIRAFGSTILIGNSLNLLLVFSVFYSVKQSKA